MLRRNCDAAALVAISGSCGGTIGNNVVNGTYYSLSMQRLTSRQRECLHFMDVEIWTTRASSDAGRDRAPNDDRERQANAKSAWLVLQQEVTQCTRCELHATRTQTVFGAGNTDAEWMLVGEAPGAEEDRQGLPFVGRAGKLLTAMISALGMRRDDVYIANVLKCRPPNNRDPMGEEVRQCEGYLHRQVSLIRPKIIVALGRFAAQSLVKTSRPIGKLRSEVFSYSDTDIPLIVTYHPAYLLRNPLDKRKAWEDLCLAKKVMSGTR